MEICQKSTNSQIKGWTLISMILWEVSYPHCFRDLVNTLITKLPQTVTSLWSEQNKAA